MTCRFCLLRGPLGVRYPRRHSDDSGTNKMHLAPSCQRDIELLLAAFVTIAIAGVASYVSARIADRLGLNDLEANYLIRAIGSTAILGPWFAWTHLRIKRHRDERSLVEH
jgi:hypothetical protein